MRNKETGEFELVVGDKQLLSGFFLGVVLLAVVFALGYVLGRGSRTPDTTAAAVQSNSVPEARPEAASPTVPPSPEPAAATPAASTADAQPPAATPPVEAPPQPTTVPARETSAAPAPAKAQPAPDPGNASYWQVLAGSPTSATALSQTLKGRGFPVETRPGPNNLTLVWVGPYTDKDSLTRAKRQLDDAGFNNHVKKP
jgi:cell division septation protein DedD